jgi:hypothetical protein
MPIRSETGWCTVYPCGRRNASTLASRKITSTAVSRERIWPTTDSHFPPACHPRYNPAMSPEDQILPRLGLVVAAFGVWLGVRIINRRERWAKRTALVIVVVPTLYVLSFGPACWWMADRSFGYTITRCRRLLTGQLGGRHDVARSLFVMSFAGMQRLEPQTRYCCLLIGAGLRRTISHSLPSVLSPIQTFRRDQIVPLPASRRFQTSDLACTHGN